MNLLETFHPNFVKCSGLNNCIDPFVGVGGPQQPPAFDGQVTQVRSHETFSLNECLWVKNVLSPSTVIPVIFVNVCNDTQVSFYDVKVNLRRARVLLAQCLA